jgi:CRISPR-associated exonuclease Cas4
MCQFTEDEFIQISALSHICYCERRYALIHLEQAWEENRFTAEGEVLHERVHAEHHESRRLFKQEYAMAVRSLEWGRLIATYGGKGRNMPEWGNERAI